MDCSIRMFFSPPFVTGGENIKEPNKEQVVLTFFYFFFLAPSYCCAYFNCCFKDLLLNVPILGVGDVECFLSVLMMLNSPLYSLLGLRVPQFGLSFFQTLSFLVGKKLQLHR